MPEELPNLLEDYLNKGKNFDLAFSIMERLDLSPEETGGLINLIVDLIFKRVSGDIFELVKTYSPSLDDEKTQGVGRILLLELIPIIEKAYKEQELELAKTPLSYEEKLRIYKERMAELEKELLPKEERVEEKIVSETPPEEKPEEEPEEETKTIVLEQQPEVVSEQEPIVITWKPSLKEEKKEGGRQKEELDNIPTIKITLKKEETKEKKEDVIDLSQI